MKKGKTQQKINLIPMRQAEPQRIYYWYCSLKSLFLFLLLCPHPQATGGFFSHRFLCTALYFPSTAVKLAASSLQNGAITDGTVSKKYFES